MLVRYIAGSFDRLDEAIVGAVIRMKIDPGISTPESIYDLIPAFKEKPLVFRDGRWFTPLLTWVWPYRRITFAPPFGSQNGVPLFLPELRHIPEDFAGIRETGFYMAGFNWLVDWLLSPVITLAALLAPRTTERPMGELLFWGVKHFTRPPYGTQLVVDAVGQKGDVRHARRLVLSHDDAYAFTAMPVVAFLKQYLEDTARRPGLWLMGQLADPPSLVQGMQKLGIAVTQEDREQVS